MNSIESFEDESLENEATIVPDDQETTELTEPIQPDPNFITISDEATANVSFKDLIPDQDLLSALEKLNFSSPTSVQAAALPPAFSGRDLIVQAQTGSGKTVVYLLPLLAALKEATQQGSASGTFALVLTPTRELALQVASVVKSIDSSAQPVCLIGGTDIGSQKDELRENSSIVVGTPGRVLDFLKQKAFRLNRCRYFVLDEADEMLSIGFLEDVRAILSRLPDKRQGLFVTATLTPRVDMLANSFLSNPLSLITPQGDDLPPVTHYYCEVGSDLMAKPIALCDIIETQRPNSAIIFCNTKSDTHLVEVLLRRRGFDARRINSELSQRQRNAVMDKLRRKELRFLVATDIAARGIDISQIDLVINYSIHEQPETYVHRTGRTGRAGRAGTAISLVGARDFGAFHFLTKVTKFDFQRLALPTEEDVGSARLAHLYEIIRQSEIDIRKIDTLIARKLLGELGGITDPAEDLEAMIAKLCRYSLEHYVAQEAASLDEEREADAPAQAPKEGRQRHDRRGERDERRSRRRDERDNEQRDDRSGSHRRTEQSDRRHPQGAEAKNEARDVNNTEIISSRPQSPPREPDQIRLYIGQGKNMGMTEDLFRELAAEMAELTTSDLTHIVIRENYGFVDLGEPQAERLINALNGIQYNGNTLPVEFAARLSQPRSQYRGGEGGRRREGGRDDHWGGGRGRGRGDRRGGGGRGHRGGGNRGGGNRNRGRRN